MNSNKSIKDRPYFFEGGLKFECTGCGKCCTGDSGTIFINDGEAEAIAAKLDMKTKVFLRDFAYPMKGGHSIKEKRNGDCVFLNGKLCGIYEVRPTQCRTFPFWPETLRSEASWNETAKSCEGIGQGKLYTKEEIMDVLNRVMNDCHDAEW